MLTNRISQNVRGWKGPLWVTQSNPLPKQGHPEQAAQDRVQAGLEYLQRRRLHNLPGQPGPGLRHPQNEEFLSHFIGAYHILALFRAFASDLDNGAKRKLVKFAGSMKWEELKALLEDRIVRSCYLEK